MSIVHLRVALLSEILRAEHMGVSPADVVEQLDRCAQELRARWAITSSPKPRSVADAQASFVRRIGGDWAVVLLYPDGDEHVLAANLEDVDMALALMDNVQSIGRRPAYIVHPAEYVPHPASGELRWEEAGTGNAALTSGLSIKLVNRLKIMGGSVVYRSSWDWARKYMLEDSAGVYSKGLPVGGAQPSRAV